MKEEKKYFKNGQLEEYGFSNQFGKQGKWFYYNEDGTIFKEIEYLNDNEHGLFIRYHDNGKIAVKSNYKEGKHDGPGIEYDENGSVREEWIYKDGNFFLINHWDESGNQTVKNGTGFRIIKSEFSVDKEYLSDGELVKRENVSRSIYLGFTPDNEIE